ncbi:hypothetical protein DAPPUDRAFT_260563 [Daphnia pulex]|uniref:Protein kinase domain-containing protein n=1 Tax=Daphnia pulex TaxID=6669 RepID=E9HJG3_DAPPU|nr:hypothetical protein DAPPUDRAFT_260563 [Daphnia pulex]|eukprot:EFX68083.1 hypothetical protein DAPPUDRAFT_260563 [Daphnia pulex]
MYIFGRDVLLKIEGYNYRNGEPTDFRYTVTIFGRHPYGSQFNIPANIVNDTPVNLKAIEEQKHPMHAIIMDMLKKNPNDRISSADVITRIANII